MRSSIGWCDITINPITGCLNGCEYCYARKMARRLRGRAGYPADDPFRPTFHPDKLIEIEWKHDKVPSRIFLNSMSDWFSQGVNPEWIHAIMDTVAKVPEHVFLVLTKRPEHLWWGWFGGEEVKLPPNLWFGVSVTNQKDVWRIHELVKRLPHQHKFVSFEPLHEHIDADLKGIEWVIIGAETGNRKGKILPELEWIIDLVEAADIAEIPVFIKDNVGAETAFVFGSVIQQFPEAMQ